MTCIVGLAKDGVVWIGGDTRGAGGYECAQYSLPKVFLNGSFIIGYTTSFRMGQLLQYSFKPKSPEPNQDLYEYMVVTFTSGIRKVFEDNGFTNTNKTEGGEFLVGIGGRLFTIQSDFAVMETSRGWDAVGCGAQNALGAMYNNEHLDSKARIENALNTAVALGCGVGAPFDFISIGEINEHGYCS